MPLASAPALVLRTPEQFQRRDVRCDWDTCQVLLPVDPVTTSQLDLAGARVEGSG